jgi:hypothetical protein
MNFVLSVDSKLQEEGSWGFSQCACLAWKEDWPEETGQTALGVHGETTDTIDPQVFIEVVRHIAHKVNTDTFIMAVAFYDAIPSDKVLADIKLALEASGKHLSKESYAEAVKWAVERQPEEEANRKKGGVRYVIGMLSDGTMVGCLREKDEDVHDAIVLDATAPLPFQKMMRQAFKLE